MMLEGNSGQFCSPAVELAEPNRHGEGEIDKQHVPKQRPWCVAVSKMVALLMADCFCWRAERRAPFVSISEATFMPAAIHPVSPFAHEHHVARSTTVAIPLSKNRAVRATDDRFRPGRHERFSNKISSFVKLFRISSVNGRSICGVG